MMFPLDWYNEFLTDISIFILRILKFIHSTAARWSCKPIIGKIILATYKAYMSALIIHMHNLLLATLPCLKWALSSLLLYTEDGRGTWMVSVQLKQRRQKWNQSILVLLPCTLCSPNALSKSALTSPAPEAFPFFPYGRLHSLDFPGLLATA